MLPTIVEPLREQWANVQAAAVTLAKGGQLPEARKQVSEFLDELCNTTILDPACGTANFLYVAMEHMKRLEGEVRDMLHSLGETQTVFEGTGHSVDPHQFLGIEINPRAAAIAELVLWIGYLQWHFRTFGARMPAEPIIKPFHNIECRDAVLEYDRKEPVLDADCKPVTRWDGQTMKVHQVTGEAVPDEAARTIVQRYVNPRKAKWPKAVFVVGNPPFIGNKYMRTFLGDGYTEALRQTWHDVPETSDYVIYWWEHAAQLLRAGGIKRFGLIATNSLRQSQNRKVIQPHLSAANPLSIVFAVPDHPWVDSSDGAAVRISMTTCEAGVRTGLLTVVVHEVVNADEAVDVAVSRRQGAISADLTIGPEIASTNELMSNTGISCPGVKLHGSGFIVTQEQAQRLGLGSKRGLERLIRPYRNGRDITSAPRNVLVIDLHGLTEEEAGARFPSVFQWLLDRVKPERDHNARQSYRENWWLFGEPRATFRPALRGLSRYICTPVTAKHRIFCFLDEAVLPDDALMNFASDDAFVLGVLSSRVHVAWALAAGSTLEDRPRYIKTLCFERFAFPDPPEEKKMPIRKLAETLDSLRKSQQALYPGLTITDMYNVLEKLRSGAALSEKDRVIHEQGLVSVLKQIHDDLDASVFDAYAWPHGLSDDEILRRLVDLNRERCDEEKRGIIRWLRSEYQNPNGAQAASTTQGALPIEPEFPEASPAVAGAKRPWPKTLPEQAQAVRAVLAEQPAGLTPEQLARIFLRANTQRVTDMLNTLVSLGQARVLEGDRYVPT